MAVTNVHFAPAVAVAREIIDGLLATGRHEIVIFARKVRILDIPVLQLGK